MTSSHRGFPGLHASRWTGFFLHRDRRGHNRLGFFHRRPDVAAGKIVGGSFAALLAVCVPSFVIAPFLILIFCHETEVVGPSGFG